MAAPALYPVPQRDLCATTNDRSGRSPGGYGIDSATGYLRVKEDEAALAPVIFASTCAAA
ncbi:MAG: hypothetical protein M3450_12125 [Actinomycetota bacterium]|nr:hypothetical protein [Actinomycetota bacterium]MDQ3642177.1 hypothetical protein [Actinomycetota bacterium]